MSDDSSSEENGRGRVSSCSSSDEEEDRRAKQRAARKRKPAPKKGGESKRSRKESKVLERLTQQVSEIQHFLACSTYPPSDWCPPEPNSISNENVGTLEQQTQNREPAESFLNQNKEPVESTATFNFELVTNLKEPTIPNASSEHLELLNSLQHFQSENWANVRYSDIQKLYSARPGFVELEVNDEIKQFEKANNLISTDRSLGAITHAVIMQSDALKNGVSELLQWTQESDNVSKESLLSKIKDCFSGDFQKISLDCLQLLCGRRADIIEQRREVFLNLVKEKFLKNSLKKIPPSSDYLFDKAQFSDFVKNNGGINKIFASQKPSFSAQEKRVISGSQAAQPGPSSCNQTGRFTAPFVFSHRYSSPQGVRPVHPFSSNYDFGVYANNERFFRPSFKPQSFAPRQQTPANARKPFRQGTFSQTNVPRGRGRGDRKY